jgi:phosphoserine phosphatase RsbU/P
MSAKETIAIREEERIVGLLRHRVREDRNPLPAVPEPGNDIESGARGQVVLDDVEERLEDAFKCGLREPMSAILAAAGVLQHQVSDAGTAHVRTILVAAERADRMLRDLLDFMHGGVAGHVSVVRRRIDLKLLCERVLDSMQREHPDHALLFACESAAAKPRVEGEWDPDHIAALLSRLVLNAVEHGPAQCVVRTTLRDLAGDAVLEVWNPGPPLHEELKERLFEPFVHGPSPLGKACGLGLGLYLSRKIVRAHGGHIEVRSESGEGTTFRVTLPKSCH